MDGLTMRLQGEMLAKACYLDFFEASDSANHRTLLLKWQELASCGKLLKWVCPCLKCRTLNVLIGEAKLDRRTIKSGVYQGLTLGQLLILLFVNNLFMSLPFAIFFFIDDINVVGFSGRDVLGRDIVSAVNWLKTWDASLDAGESNLLSNIVESIKIVHEGSIYTTDSINRV